jgi:glycerol-3-phosphate acyltransferase PlsX
VRAVAAGDADAVISAGNTGAMLAAGLLHLRRLPGVFRPAIAVPLPARNGVTVLIDAGANADSRPEHLVQFASMARSSPRRSSGRANPTVRLLSIGEEPEKGDQMTIEAHELLRESPSVNFAGKRRGARPPPRRGRRDRHRRLHGQPHPQAPRGNDPRAPGRAADGDRLHADRQARGSPDPPGRRRLRTRLDPDTYGGAYLLGLKGLAVIAHGNSGRRAVANGIRLAARGVEHRVVERLAERLPVYDRRASEPAPNPMR